MKILCNVGPLCKDYLENLSFLIDKNARVNFISSYEKFDQTKIIKNYKILLKKNFEIIDNNENHQTIKRCRLLREFPYEKALKHVCITRNLVQKLLKDENFDLILSEIVDQFFYDILFQEAKKLKIHSFGICWSFINDFFRITNYGEPIFIREPKRKEVLSLLDKLLIKNYIPDFIRKEKTKPFKSYLKKYIFNNIKIIYYFIHLYFLDKKNNYFYEASFLESIKSMHFFPVFDLGNKNWKKSINNNKKVMFIPLQCFPEATIDYWSKDIEMVDYEEKLLLFLKKLSNKFQIIVKEHPWGLGFRNPSFYKKIRNVSRDIIFIPTNVPVSKCIDESDLVFIWTGSTGFEAALRGKPVLSVCKPYYASGNSFKKITLETSIEEINEFTGIEFFKNFSKDDQFKLANNILRIIAPGKCQIYGGFNKNKSEDLENLKKVSFYIQKLINEESLII